MKWKKEIVEAYNNTLLFQTQVFEELYLIEQDMHFQKMMQKWMKPVLGVIILTYIELVGW
jgi:hypothetical protein